MDIICSDSQISDDIATDINSKAEISHTDEVFKGYLSLTVKACTLDGNSIRDSTFQMMTTAVVSCRRGGASSTFDRLNKYFLISNMHVVGSQYWNQVHGFTPSDVRKDEEGLQTMRAFAQNMAWLLT